MAQTKSTLSQKSEAGLASLAELRERHVELLRLVPTERLQDEHVTRVKEFLERGAATGVTESQRTRQAARPFRSE